MRISDWSSDVCSSDLRDHIWEVYGATEGLVRCWIGGREWLERPGSVGRPIGGGRLQIGRASGRERVCQYVEITVVAVSLKKETQAKHRYVITVPYADTNKKWHRSYKQLMRQQN